MPYSDGPCIASFASRPVYKDAYSTAPPNSLYGFSEERASLEPKTVGPLQQSNPAYRDEVLDNNGVSVMRPPTRSPGSYENPDRLEHSGQAASQLSRIPTSFQSPYSHSENGIGFSPVRPPLGLTSRMSYQEVNQRSPSSAGNHSWEAEYTIPQDRAEYLDERVASREAAILPEPKGYERAPRRFRGGRDEFAQGQVQHLPKIQVQQARERDLDFEPVSLDHQEQNDILSRVNRRLSQCAFDFIAMYQFPIPLEAGKPMVRVATDRAWTEWVYLLKRLATKRRIPSRAIYDGQIKELTTLLDNSVEMRHSTKPQARPLKDDRHVLQLISAGIQVGRMLKDATTMEYLDRLYKDTEVLIQQRKSTSRYSK